MAWLPDGEILKICLFVLTQSTNVTDGQTYGRTHRHHMTVKAALDASIAQQKDSARRSVLLKLTTDRNEAARGLFATAELLVRPVRWFVRPRVRSFVETWEHDIVKPTCVSIVHRRMARSVGVHEVKGQGHAKPKVDL